MLIQVLQWVFETDFVFMFCKTADDKRVVLKIHSLKLQTFILVDANSLPSELIESFQYFLHTYSIPSELVKKKRFGTFVDGSGKNHCQFQFLSITHPSNAKPLRQVRGLLSYFEKQHGISLKTFHLNIDPVVRIFQTYPNFTPCMFIEFDPTTNSLIKSFPSTTRRIQKSVYITTRNYQADTMYSFPISQLTPAKHPPSYNFPIRVVAFDFETTGTDFKNDSIYQVSVVFETMFIRDGVQKNTQYFLLNVGECDTVFLEDNEGFNKEVTLFQFENERGLLVKFMDLLSVNEWDCITGYNVYGFDFNMLKCALDKYRLGSLLKKWNRILSTNDKIGRFHTKMSGKGEGYLDICYPNIMGRFHLDIQPVIVKNFKMKSYALGKVSTKFLGMTKIDLPFDCNHPKPCIVEKCKSQKSLYQLKTPKAFAEIGTYCVVDSYLCILLVKTLNIIGNQIEFSNVVYFPLEHLFTSGEMKKIGAQIFVNGFALGFVFEDKPYIKNNTSSLDISGVKKYQGALVLDPKVGAYVNNIITCLGTCIFFVCLFIYLAICFYIIVPIHVLIYLPFFS